MGSRKPFTLRLDDDGALDEMVCSMGTANVHLERLDSTTWWLSITAPDATMITLRVDARSLIVEQDTPVHGPIWQWGSCRYGSRMGWWRATWRDEVERLLDIVHERHPHPVEWVRSWWEVLRG